MSFAFVTIFASHLEIKVLHQAEFALKISQGIAKTSFHKSSPSLAVIREPDFSLASITTIHSLIPATTSFLTGKL
jgi:hypothetical protein